ncbi:MAG: outer membrane lipoprotein carrier protein LolA [Bacteroidales bacterium]|jgi:outer membrane lipoprotein-sorting protein|nr:outer membrane lipoprotein carrier protein LolA [Bacteroidales bacterium]MDD4215298.1 outer membrane lipoprotein carrier protein LolA [Bacteroidales bacterium]
MKKLMIYAAALIVTLQVNAQDNTKAKNILDGVSQQIKSYTTMNISFTFTVENTKKKTKESQTGIANIKGDKYFLEYAGQEVYSDGKTLWTFLKDVKEVHINNLEENTETILNPMKMVTEYNKNFTPKFIKEEARGSKIIQIIDLTPMKAKSYYKVRIEIDKIQKNISGAIIYDKNGMNTYTYTITKFITNQDIPDSRFTFKTVDHPGVEVIDLR